ncbi:Hypothetical predicted protein [Paramuricea clavata]|uniref:Uncharacterized protein n=1 Tax=Paramuricea clavata TaxID=317549 RepID=A0A7D9DP22_PARCT|nr:Hypothetical predicted protein [Paramuricea clavata]
MDSVRQNTYIGENEDKVKIQELLFRDDKFLTLVKEMWRYYLKLPVGIDEIQSNIVNGGCIITFPQCYFYFENMYIIAGSSTRRLVIGCVCFSLGFCGLIEVDFYMQPCKSMYIATDRVWSPPFWLVTTSIDLICHDEEYVGSLHTFIYQKTKLFMAAIDQCTQCSDDVLREVCNTILHMYPSYRLACIIKYLLKLQYIVKDFMTSSCKCITWSTERRNLQYVPPRCRCETMCASCVAQFKDLGYVCD